jgi:hypothetical protein
VNFLFETELNRAQKLLLLIALAILVLQALFPPWKVVFFGDGFNPGDWFTGFAFLLTPPSPSANAYQYHARLELHPDWTLLSALWAVTALLAGGACWIFRRRAGEADSGFFNMLESRKLWLSLLIAAGAPVPLEGIPTAFIAPYLLAPGFEAMPALFHSGVSFLRLATGSYLIFWILGYAESVRVKAAVAGVAAMLLFVSGIAGRSAVDARDHALAVHPGTTTENPVQP